jgi:hypothetical protein
MSIIEEGDRLEPVVAGTAIPEVRYALRPGLNPIGGRDRLAALGARIFARQIAEVGSHHGASPFCTFLIESGWDSFTA